MARFSKIQVLNTMMETGFVPLFYHDDIDVSKNLVDILYKGGARVIEFTSRGDMAFKVFDELITYCNKNCPEIILGVGSVTDAGAASLYMQLGANFVVTPVLREDIALICNRRNVPWFPGCGSLTEIAKAEELGCDIIKLFPGGIYGPEFVKSIKGPQPWTNIMPTGGVSTDEANLKSWFEAGVVCVGIGSKLISKQMLQSGDFSSLETTVRDTLNKISKIRN